MLIIKVLDNLQNVNKKIKTDTECYAETEKRSVVEHVILKA